MSTSRDRRKKVIDWASIRQRLARAVEASAENLRLSPERARALMDERARILARVPAEPATAAQELEVVVFEFAGQAYAIETVYVRQVVRFLSLTPLPGAPDFLAGIMNLRGQMLAVIDLGKFCGGTTEHPTEPSRILVLGSARPEFGVLADTVQEVAVLPEERVRTPELPQSQIGSECLRGVTAEGLIVLNGAALLRDPRLFVDQGENGGT